MASSTGGGWAQLRQQARNLETQTESLFSTYSQYATSTTLPPKPSEEETRLESQIHTLLTKRTTLLAQLTRLLDSESALTSSALKQSNLSRHHEILTQHNAEYDRLHTLTATSRQKSNLLTNIRADISEHRERNPAAEEADYMLDERARIDRSHGIADTVLAQAYAVNESFGLQRETLASVNRRIVGAASQVPGINSLINRIGAKKRRDGIILGCFIAFCFLVVVWLR
ncbi:putative vesicle transport v-SNARE protein Gos1 [Tothia fuscella]|uniref:Golgi SNAP receptor complex member 1 n=1 Tax=Tothia fuscella TaxID=1048955 RepID=A0A9P4NR26_9PEZI|nr:putative vesicle transport v-SNARE protein Gos1 [Tothia fuscella]